MSEYPEGFNLHPHPADLSKALHSLITFFDWSRFIFLYESGQFQVDFKNVTFIFNNIFSQRSI